MMLMALAAPALAAPALAAPSPPPPAPCASTCGLTTCADLRDALSCVALANAGCNCYGCCFDELPPPEAPPPPSTPPVAPPVAVSAFSSATTADADVEICGDIDSDAWLRASTAYVLTCPSFVRSGATLHVEAGCRVTAAAGSSNNVTSFGQVDVDGDGSITAAELTRQLEWQTVPRPAIGALFAELDSDGSVTLDLEEWAEVATAAATLNITALAVPGGALIVERGGRLLADGRAEAPISFDAQGDGGSDGDGWGGVVVMGSAPVAASLPCPPHLAACSVASSYGGSAVADSSGVLRYVRVSHARRGLSLYGVGNGTLVDHCEVAFSATDGISLHGGTVDVRHLSALFAAGSGVRVAAGYRGRGQYLFIALGAQGHGGITLASTLAEHAENATYASAAHPQFFSLTVLGGGAEGQSSSSLLRLGDGAGGELGNALLVHSPGTGVATPLPPAGPGLASPLDLSQWRSPPPPSPPLPAEYVAAPQYPGRECALQHEDGVSEGITPSGRLGVYASADECALAAGARFERDRNCSSFQYSAAHPLWGCICCVQAAGGRRNPLWDVFTAAGLPPPWPSLPNRLPHPPPAPSTPLSSLPPPPEGSPTTASLYLSRSTVVSDVAVPFGSTAPAEQLSPPGPQQLSVVLAEPGLMAVQRSCLTSDCLQATSTFNPLPSSSGAACLTAPEDASARDGGQFLERVPCSGAFRSSSHADNWLAGWSLLFPASLGADVSSAAQLDIAQEVTAKRLILGMMPPS